MPQRPLVYLLFGVPDSERRSVLFDLVEGGLPAEEQVLYFHPRGEPGSPFDEQIEALENVTIVDWEIRDSKVKHGHVSASPDRIFFLAPGSCDPADAAEALKAWTLHNDCDMGRIITILHCSFLKAQPKAKAWFDACIHFSDVVLLSRRDAVDNKWIKEFESGYRKACYPCQIELVTKGKAKNPPAVLEPQARRMSLYFDKLIPIEDDEFEDEEQPDDLKPDRYIERNESGQRVHPIIDINKLLANE